MKKEIGVDVVEETNLFLRTVMIISKEHPTMFWKRPKFEMEIGFSSLVK